MPSNLDRFKGDLDKLIQRGKMLELSMRRDCFKIEIESRIKKQLGAKASKFLKDLPYFKNDYQGWYSEALALLRQVLPDRVSDFVRHYEKPKLRKDITFENYRIDDYLQGLNVTRGWEKVKVVSPDAAIPHFEQQLAIVLAAESRFNSALFEIRQLVQADLLDSELEAAKVLIKAKFTRAAGALAGVVLERHLIQVCDDHQVKIPKKNPGISDLNDILKEAIIVDVPQWRFIQHLADIRNLCYHSKKQEPTSDQVADLIDGVAKITKTIF